ncbi:MAG: NAD(P)-binding domain-containing protein [Candidatus Electryonea clarkiae]|nr:NAD(P)-binding domain-containing protein [Candidatus Electryonea clarkiae]MDP8287260.1 NAD(P)-binding domain-containing protein [Candidatus Electryonea clarkiae]
MIEFLIYLFTGIIVVTIPLLYFFAEKRKSRKAEQVYDNAVHQGMDEPVSLHPFINPDKCIAVGACVKACPEKDVLGLINNKGQLINPSHCIGHGACEAACPVDAIDLVFGTEKRGVDIPFVSEKFETNIEGMYIAGELGGMGLIRNAITQGKQAVEFISSSRIEKSDKFENDIVDLIIIGAGPTGIAASLQAKKEELNFLTFDQDDFGGTILSFPRRKLVMTQPFELPLYGKVKVREIEKEALIEILDDAIKETDIKIKTGTKIEDVKRENGSFIIKTNDGDYKSKRVLLATGRRGTPRKLNVEGEGLPKVAYRLLEPEIFRNMNILIAGGGDSAVETALALSEQVGNNVHLSYRRDSIFRIKPDNKTKLDRAISEDQIKPLFSSEVKKIEKDFVILEQKGKDIKIQNDQVFVMIGGEMPTGFLEKIGIEISRKFGEK